MSVFIEGMTKPKNCCGCEFNSNDCFCKRNYGRIDRDDWSCDKPCPIIDVPAPHSRLLDENDVINAIHDRLHELQTHKEFQKKHGDIDLLGVMPYIAKIPTVIEAEGTE